MAIAFPPRLQALIRARLGPPEPRPLRQPWVSEDGSVMASPAGFQSMKALAEGKLAQHRRTPVLAHLQVRDPYDVGCMLSATEIARELQKYQHDPAFRGVRRVPLRALARVAGVGKQTICEAAKGKRISDRSRLRLSLVIKQIRTGELRLRRYGRTGRWERVINEAPTPLR